MNKKLTRIAFIGFFTITSSLLIGQNIVFKEIVKQDSIKGKFGPNLKHFGQTFFEYGTILPNSSQTADNQRFYSPSLGIGLRYKYRFNNTFSAGIALAYQYDEKRFNYLNSLANSRDSISSTSFIKYQIRQDQFSLRPYLRINFGKRGNNLGKYLELGGFINWIAQSDDLLKFTNKLGQKTTILTDHTKSINTRYLYGIGGAIGLKNLSLYTRIELINTKPNIIAGYTTVGISVGF